YLDPRSTVRRQFIAPGASISTAGNERHAVTVRDGRPVQDSFTLDVQGFEIARHPTAFGDLAPRAEDRAALSGYEAEVCRFVRERLGADQVLSRGWELRRSVDPAAHGAQPPAAGVHVDYAPDHVPGMVARAHARHLPGSGGF